VTTAQGEAITPNTPYQHGITIFYQREQPDEPKLPFVESILFEDEHLLVADKPHFLPVTPSGNVVQECLLARLQTKGHRDLVPVHRLDRDTAGVVIFSKRRQERALYASLFETQQVRRLYRAVALVDNAPTQHAWTIEDRLEPEPGSFRMRSVPGKANALTNITFLESRNRVGLFELIPSTGKKHQLRIHMMNLGFPILNDAMYPALTVSDPGDYSQPLQLLAAELAFACPISQTLQTFKSERLLTAWPQ
jgi:tRNA pseudouridine32 synthase / 23S rRNA pseudouridine746 synthase